jgi:hypothetical protein
MRLISKGFALPGCSDRLSLQAISEIGVASEKRPSASLKTCLLGALRSARARRYVGLALVAIGWFDAQRVCNALLGGGAGLCRANSGVVAALGQLLSYS